MALSDFIKTQIARNMFDSHIEKPKINFKDIPCLLSSGGHDYAMGIAGDYLVKIRFAQLFANKTWSMGWIAESAVEMLKEMPLYWKHYEKYRKHMNLANQIISEFVEGDDSLTPRILNICQWMAKMDDLYRFGRFYPDFQLNKNIEEELTKLNSIMHFDGIDVNNHVLLNPGFEWSHRIDGANADIIFDDNMLEIKMTSNISLGIENIRKMLALSALYELSGTKFEDNNDKHIFQSNIKKLFVYYPRYNHLIGLETKNLVKDYSLFLKDFEKELEKYENKNYQENTVKI